MDSSKNTIGRDYYRMSVLNNQNVVRRPAVKKNRFGTKVAAASLCGLLAASTVLYAAKFAAENLPVSRVSAQSSIEQRAGSVQDFTAGIIPSQKYELSKASNGNVTFDLEGRLYSFSDMTGSSRYSKSVPSSSPIDMVIVEWTGTRNATYEGVKTKYDVGNMYMINSESRTCYRKIPVVGGIYTSGNPTSPHNLKMIAGGAVDKPYYAKKDIAGGDPRNPFGDGLVKLYDVDQKYSIDQLMTAIDKGKLGFPSMHDQRQIHGKASAISGLGFTIGCIRIDNPEIRYLIENKDDAFLLYFKN